MPRTRGRPSPVSVYLILHAAQSFLFTLAFVTHAAYRVESVGLNPLQLVLLGTALELAVLAFEIPTGVVADLYGRRASVIIGVTIVGAGLIVEGLFPVWSAVLAAQIVWGIGYTFISGAEPAWIADEVGEQRAPELFLRANQAGSLARLAGIPAGAAAATLQLNLPFVLGGLGFLGLAAWLLVRMPETRPALRAGRGRTAWADYAATLHAGVAQLRVRPALIWLLVIGALAGMSSEAFDRLADARLITEIGLPPLGNLDPVAWFAVIAAGSTLLGIGALEVVRRHVNLTSAPAIARLLLLNETGIIAGLAAFALAGEFWPAVLAAWTVRITRGVHAPVYLAWLNHRLDSRVRATVLSLAGQADALGQVAGGPLLGIIATLHSIEAAILAGGAVLLVNLALYAALERSETRATPAPAQSDR